MSIDSTPFAHVESKPGPEVIIAGYMFSAVSLGAQFGASPYPNYVTDTARTLINDLLEYGYAVTDRQAPCATCGGVGWIVVGQTMGDPYGEQNQCPDCKRLEQLRRDLEVVSADRSWLTEMVMRLTEEKVQDAATIDYWMGQHERRCDDYHTLYGQCEDIKESYRDCASALAAANRHIAHLATERDEARREAGR